MPLILEIVTPEEIVYSETVDSVVLPGVEGEAGILPGHIPLLTMLKPGELIVTKGGEKIVLAVDKGFAQVLGDKVSVLAEGAIDIKEIDLTAVGAGLSFATLVWSNGGDGTGSTITFSAGNTLTFTGLVQADFAEEDFAFV